MDQVRHHAIHCRHGLDNGSIQVARPRDLWDEQSRLYLTGGLSSFAGDLIVQPRSFNGVLTIVCVRTDSSPPYAMFLDSTKIRQTSPAIHNPSRIFQLPRSLFVSNQVIYDKKHQPTKFSISMSLEEGTDDHVPMYCIDIKVDKTDPRYLPTISDFMERMSERWRPD